MCGILFWECHGDESVAVSHLQKIQHRGPDGSVCRRVGPYVMGFHRLAIIDTSDKGMQPFDTPETVLICNGEIYNYKDLVTTELRSDVDCISSLVPSIPCEEPLSTVLDTIESLDGDFAFVLASKDVSQPRYIVARDRFGVSPLFYGINDEGKPIAFASEVKALYGGHNIAAIRVFPPGHCYFSSKNTFLPFTPNVSIIRPDDIGINTLLHRAVKKRLDHSDRPVALLCSGGVDSALVTSIAARCLAPGSLHVFTMKYDTGASDDAFYAKMLCDHHGFKHTLVTFNKEDVHKSIDEVIRVCETYDPNTIRAAIPMYLLARHIAQTTDIKVILSGEGADELFAGYAYFSQIPSGEALNEETARLIKNIHMFDLLRADRCFAAWGLEVRVPFLDKELVRYVSALDGCDKMFVRGAEKALLRDSFEEFEELKSLRIIDRPKEKFSDGCGYSYVPQLLSFIAPDATTLSEKLRVEKKLYKGIFESFYGVNNSHLIVSRVMPAWCDSAVKNIELN